MNIVPASKQRILIVDDDREIRELVAEFIGAHGYIVETAASAQEAYARLEKQRYSLVVLDVMMPGEDGLSVCRTLRAQSAIPIIMLTALGDDTDRIVGLEIGADDYLPKPFNPRELLARIKAVLRRYTNEAASARRVQSRDKLCFSGWVLDLSRRELRSPLDSLVTLTSGEYALLQVFVDHPQHVLTRDQLLEATKGRDAGPFDRSVDVQLSRLRKKIEADPKNPQLIKTVRSGGYILASTVESLS